MDRPATVATETFDYLRQQGFVWSKWVSAFHDATTWRQLWKVNGGWAASVHGRNASPVFPDPISAYVYAETNGWTSEETTL